MLLLTEFFVTILALPIALAAPRIGHKWFSAVEEYAQAFSARRGLGVFTVLLLALGARLAVLPVEPVPQPAVADEFSYLLMGDTFAHGRLTNPTHVMWKHFETITVLQKPTYCSMYYPGQGLFLALGEVVFGHPFWGVWLSAGLMCAAICWALQGWLPPVWAFLGGILAVIRLGTFTYWADSYWGGAVTAIGGALALGALPRIKRYHRVQDAVVMAVGLSLLASTRPFEGLFFSAPILLALLFFFFRRASRESSILLLRRVVFPLALMVVVAAGGLFYYFFRTTGNPLRPPYIVNVDTYFAVPSFPWLPLPRLPHYNHEVMKALYTGPLLQEYNNSRHHAVETAGVRSTEFWAFFLGPLLSLPLGAALLTRRDNRLRRFPSAKTRFFLTTCVACAIANLLPVWYKTHYSAPMTCALYGIVVQSFRHLRLWRCKRQMVGTAMSRLLIAATMLLFLIRVAAEPFHIPVPVSPYHAWFSRGAQNAWAPGVEYVAFARAQVIRSLVNTPGQHLLIVRYSPAHDVNREWVYNCADIDSAKVVWARDMGPAENQKLIDYFKDRHVWLLEPDRNLSVTHYDPATEAVGVAASLATK